MPKCNVEKRQADTKKNRQTSKKLQISPPVMDFDHVHSDI